MHKWLGISRSCESLARYVCMLLNDRVVTEYLMLTCLRKSNYTSRDWSRCWIFFNWGFIEFGSLSEEQTKLKSDNHLGKMHWIAIIYCFNIVLAILLFTLLESCTILQLPLQGVLMKISTWRCHRESQRWLTFLSERGNLMWRYICFKIKPVKRKKWDCWHFDGCLTPNSTQRQLNCIVVINYRIAVRVVIYYI